MGDKDYYWVPTFKVCANSHCCPNGRAMTAVECSEADTCPLFVQAYVAASTTNATPYGNRYLGLMYKGSYWCDMIGGCYVCGRVFCPLNPQYIKGVK